MANRKSFLLRIDPSVLEAVQRWANDDLRSLNGQSEFILRRALAQTGRMRVGEPSRVPDATDDVQDVGEAGPDAKREEP